MANGILTKGIKLKVYNSAASGTDKYEEIAGMTEFPSLGGTKEKIDVTTLADKNRQYIPGIEDYGDLTFKFIFDPALYQQLSGYDVAVKQWCVEFPDSPATKFYFDGIADVTIDGAGVNAAITMSLNIFLQSDVSNTEPTHQ